jgi:hypothetical protein
VSWQLLGANELVPTLSAAFLAGGLHEYTWILKITSFFHFFFLRSDKQSITKTNVDFHGVDARAQHDPLFSEARRL